MRLASTWGGLGISAALAAATRRAPTHRVASRGDRVMGRSQERKGRGGPTRTTAGPEGSLAPVVALYGQATRRRGPNQANGPGEGRQARHSTPPTSPPLAGLKLSPKCLRIKD